MVSASFIYKAQNTSLTCRWEVIKEYKSHKHYFMLNNEGKKFLKEIWFVENLAGKAYIFTISLAFGYATCIMAC